jgi:uncharacterized protein (TIGR02001 family)
MRLMFVALIASAATTGAAAAQTPLGQSGFAIESSASVVSDYRFRGVSLSDDKPALQLEATLSHESGFYAGAFTSSIAEYGVDADGDGARAEVDFSGGWAFSLAGFDIDAGAVAYLYPDASDVNYYVLPVSISRAFGDVTVTAGYEYTPAQRSLADLDGSYVWLGADWGSEFLPVSLSASLGREDGAWAPEGKSDWMIGAFYALDRFQLGLSWTGADDADAGSAVIAALSSRF